MIISVSKDGCQSLDSIIFNGDGNLPMVLSVDCFLNKRALVVLLVIR